MSTERNDKPLQVLTVDMAGKSGVTVLRGHCIVQGWMDGCGELSQEATTII